MSPRAEHLAEGVSLYLGDCRDVLPNLPRADVVITDPPYGIAATWKGGKGHGWGNADDQKAVRNEWDAKAPDLALLEAIVAKADEVVIWGGAIVRKGGAVACTIDEPIPGFRGLRKRWWDRAIERPFPEWKTR